MKFAVVILACVAAASAQYNSGAYNPFGNQYRNPYKFQPTPAPYRPYRLPSSTPVYTPVVYKASTPSPVVPVPIAVARQVDARNAQIVKFGNEANPDGSYAYFYETDNGIAAQEQGTPRNFGGNPPVVPVVAQGSFSWTSPEGEPIAISYVADENGYQPSGNAIPTAPPVPAQIARALAYVAGRGAPLKK
ncbi:larval cuticle protein LCP-22 [Helicoverpa armigera]|uniref:Cuticle protein 22 n=1 Tax=Helicoverpa armigera TaxID=29058 RepID=A0A8T9IS00_HELAM|nr:larval cuticle protein LCP-22 [Helicoverpa armigera]XP_047020475.1 larval cuticle protein LCP-22-like [Helicoverpa zea]PZC85399.1 hypothetical protein B5X24_HaOG201895 [Helicoverpa armigera]UNO37373.1 cuticle protein 22 [Helicoverpa armigera]